MTRETVRPWGRDTNEKVLERNGKASCVTCLDLLANKGFYWCETCLFLTHDQCLIYKYFGIEYGSMRVCINCGLEAL